MNTTNGNTKSTEDMRDELLERSLTITDTVFKRCVDIVDTEFNDGYAIKNPQLLAAVLVFQQKMYSQVMDNHLNSH